MALLTIPGRYLAQPQGQVQIAPEYQDAVFMALFNTPEWRDLTGNHILSSTTIPTGIISRHGRTQRFGDGLGTHLRTSGNIPALSRFTVFAWVRPGTMGTGYKRILETNYSVNFFLGSSNTGNRYNFIVANSSLTACVGGQQVVGNRDFVGGVYNGTHCILYVNGREAARTTASAPFVAKALCVGANEGNTNSGEHWVGEIDTIAIFPREFSADQMLSLYHDPYQLLRQPQRRIWFTPSTGVNLTIANASQGNSAGTGGVTQAHALSISNAAQGNAASAVALGQAHALLPENAAQGNTASTGEISSGNALAVADAQQQNTAATGTVSQTHALTVPDLSQPNTASTGAISGGTVINLTISASVQSNTAESNAIDQTHVLVITASAQGNSAESVSITQVHALNPASATQNNLASDGAVVSFGDLVVADLVQGNMLTGGNVTTTQTVSISSAEQDNRVSSGALLANVIYEAAMTAQAAVIQSRIKKPGIPHDTEQWLRTMLEIIIGRRNNKIEVPQQQNLTFSGTPTKAEVESLYAYTNEVRSTLEQLINRLDS